MKMFFAKDIKQEPLDYEYDTVIEPIEIMDLKDIKQEPLDYEEYDTVDKGNFYFYQLISIVIN